MCHTADGLSQSAAVPAVTKQPENYKTVSSGAFSCTNLINTINAKSLSCLLCFCSSVLNLLRFICCLTVPMCKRRSLTIQSKGLFGNCQRAATFHFTSPLCKRAIIRFAVCTAGGHFCVSGEIKGVVAQGRRGGPCLITAVRVLRKQPLGFEERTIGTLAVNFKSRCFTIPG